MATLSSDAARDFFEGAFREYPVIASDIIYQGAAVGDNGSGYARPLSAGDKFLGFADYQSDNSDGSAGDKYVRVRRRGAVKLDVSGAVITDVGIPVYASDDDTFVFSPVGNSFVGKVGRWSEAGVVVVDFDAERMADPYAEFTVRETISANKTLDAEDTGKLFWVDTDAKIITLPATGAGLSCIIVNGGADGTVAVNVSPNAADQITGPDITAAADKDLINTKATAQRGDLVELADIDNTDGYVVQRLVGTWAREA